MNLFRDMKSAVEAEIAAMIAAGSLPEGLDTSRITVEPPRDAAHGDVATNAAMVLAKPAGLKPRDIATGLAERLSARPEVDGAEVAGPGFINLRIAGTIWQQNLRDVLRHGANADVTPLGGGAKVNVEYVSANPTGPLHIGHARGTVFGDALASLLAQAGFEVTREYYINDAGAQVETLARSAYLRYREALGEDIGTIPEGFYPGEYLVPIGKAMADRDGDRWMQADEADWLPEFRSFTTDRMMDLVRADLAALGVHHDLFVSERGLVEAGKVDAALQALEARGLIYTGVLEPPKGKQPEDWEARPQTLFKATEFGDDVDRALRKSDNSWTYFAGDIAYHYDKFERGFTEQIDVWGADHGGYVKRLQAATKAITGGKARLDVRICQIVRILDHGEPVKMSKRAGSFVTLRDLIEEVGKDVVRFIMLTRKNDAPLDFDLGVVTEQSKDNPVFYVQYAHARCHSVRRMAEAAFPGVDFSAQALAESADPAWLTHEAEIALLKRLADWPRLVEGAADAHEPHRIAFFLYDLASGFHALWTRGSREDVGLRFVIEDDVEVTKARLAMARGVESVIAAGLRIFGVTPAEEM